MSDEGTTKALNLEATARIWPWLSCMCHIHSTSVPLRGGLVKMHENTAQQAFGYFGLSAGHITHCRSLIGAGVRRNPATYGTNQDNWKRRFPSFRQAFGYFGLCDADLHYFHGIDNLQHVSKSSFPIALICAISRRTPATASINQGPERGDLMPL